MKMMILITDIHGSVESNMVEALENGGGKKRRATDKEPVSVGSGRLCGAIATLCLKRRKQKKSPIER